MSKYTKPTGGLKAADLIKDRVNYIDKVQVWLAKPIATNQVKKLARLCGSLHTHEKAMPFLRDWQQRLQLYQPSENALAYLDELSAGEHLINGLEIALDFIVAGEAEAEELRKFFDYHLIKQWHGKQKLARVESVSYWGKRTARNQPILYDDRPCKVTGEVDCVHLEWRTREGDAVRAHGIASLKDLIGFDHDRFWRRNLHLRAVDFSKLGRVFISRGKRRRRKPLIKEWVPGLPFDYDRRVGYLIARMACPDGWQIGAAQTIIDHCRKRGVDPAAALMAIPAAVVLGPMIMSETYN